MQRMPVLCQANIFAGKGTNNHSNYMAVRGLGIGHGGALYDSKRRIGSLASSGGQIHQVG